MTREDQIKNLVYYQWLLTTGGARPDYCKQNIDDIMYKIPIDEWDDVKEIVTRRVNKSI